MGENNRVPTGNPLPGQGEGINQRLFSAFHASDLQAGDSFSTVSGQGEGIRNRGA